MEGKNKPHYKEKQNKNKSNEEKQNKNIEPIPEVKENTIPQEKEEEKPVLPQVLIRNYVKVQVATPLYEVYKAASNVISTTCKLVDLLYHNRMTTALSMLSREVRWPYCALMLPEMCHVDREKDMRDLQYGVHEIAVEPRWVTYNYTQDVRGMESRFNKILPSELLVQTFSYHELYMWSRKTKVVYVSPCLAASLIKYCDCSSEKIKLFGYIRLKELLNHYNLAPQDELLILDGTWLWCYLNRLSLEQELQIYNLN